MVGLEAELCIACSKKLWKPWKTVGIVNEKDVVP